MDENKTWSALVGKRPMQLWIIAQLTRLLNDTMASSTVFAVTARRSLQTGRLLVSLPSWKSSRSISSTTALGSAAGEPMHPNYNIDSVKPPKYWGKPADGKCTAQHLHCTALYYTCTCTCTCQSMLIFVISHVMLTLLSTHNEFQI